MPFQMKIQPIDYHAESTRIESGKPVLLRSRLRRLFDRQFPSVLRKPSAAGGGESLYHHNKEAAAVTEFEPSSLCLDKMVRSFMEDSSNNNSGSSEKKCVRNKCNCFNGNSTSSSEDDEDSDALGAAAFDESISAPADSSEMLKSLVPCASLAERNLLADIAKIADKNKHCRRKDELIRLVTVGLSSLTYDASVCKLRWDKSPSYPAGEYEFIDVVAAEGGEKLLVDIDFRSEFEIARPTGAYKAILQSLPYIFVGKPDRLQQIVAVVSEAARQSLRKKGMPVPPWRTAAYMRAKWLSPRTRTPTNDQPESPAGTHPVLIFGDPDSNSVEVEPTPTPPAESPRTSPPPEAAKQSSAGEKPAPAMVLSPWQPPAVRPKSCCERGAKIVPGLASLLNEKP